MFYLGLLRFEEFLLDIPVNLFLDKLNEIKIKLLTN